MTQAQQLAERVRKSLRIRQGWHGDPDAWGADVQAGAQLLTARIWRRRQSPAGVESVGELGAVYVQRRDPDVAMLLGLGTWRPPLVG